MPLYPGNEFDRMNSGDVDDIYQLMEQAINNEDKEAQLRQLNKLKKLREAQKRWVKNLVGQKVYCGHGLKNLLYNLEEAKEKVSNILLNVENK